MQGSFLIATAAILAGGLTEGSFLLPMKLVRRWAWENIWLVFSIAGLLLMPWVAAIWTVPQLGAVYGAVPKETLILTGLFGFGWGVGNVLFGLAVPMVGMSLTFAIVVGLSASLGCLVPLIVTDPGRLREPSGMMVLAGVGLTCAGIIALGIAGHERERSQKKWPGNLAGNTTSNARLGLVFCLLSGLLAPMLNYSFAFGAPISAEAVAHGADRLASANAIWAIALLGGFLGNGGFAAFKLIRNRTWSGFGSGECLRSFSLSASMGFLFTGGLLLYGWGVTHLGNLGPAIGWPIFQAVMILLSSGIGIAMGEWRGAERRSFRLSLVGLGILLTAIVVLSVGNSSI